MDKLFLMSLKNIKKYEKESVLRLVNKDLDYYIPPRHRGRF